MPLKTKTDLEVKERFTTVKHNSILYSSKNILVFKNRFVFSKIQIHCVLHCVLHGEDVRKVVTGCLIGNIGHVHLVSLYLKISNANVEEVCRA